MNLSQQEFDGLLKNKSLVITLMGMSNIGKSYWSKMLSRIGFKRFCCDDMIEAKLGPEFEKLGYRGINGVSKWMGQPYDKRFTANQKRYLQAEIESLEKILYYLKNRKGGNVVIDTTGSVIHTSDEICLALKQYSLMVYIKADDDAVQQMVAKYLELPKPVVWAGIFQPIAGEAGEETIKRYYPELLKRRDALYAFYADVIIPCQNIRYDVAVKQFLANIRKSL
jgi:shikimate kinase